MESQILHEGNIPPDGLERPGPRPRNDFITANNRPDGLKLYRFCDILSYSSGTNIPSFPSLRLRNDVKVALMKILVTIPLLCLLILAPHPATARTWLVSTDGSGDAPTIQAAMDSALAGDVVMLECGIYYEHDISLKHNVLLTSLTGEPDCAIIDAGKAGRVLSCVALARISGITLKNGMAPCSDDGYGNLECYGGGVFLPRGRLEAVNCAFLDNYTSMGPSQATGKGGGIYCFASTVTLTDCTFHGNKSQWGGGIYCESSWVTLTGCRFYDNFAEFGGGGLSCREVRFGVTMTGCVFARNITPKEGGGVYAWSQSSASYGSAIDNCTFNKNEAAERGAGVCWVSAGSTLGVSRTIIAFSTQGNAFTFARNNILEPDVTVSCCDFYGNAGGDWVDGIEGQADVNGNFSLDPRFCSEETDDLGLKQCSPCAPGNHPDGTDCGQVGALPVACPGTAVQETTWGRIKSMFR